MARAITLNNTTSCWGFGALALARMALGATFLWAFFDKLLGLGFATCRAATSGVITMGCQQAWVHGGSPTKGFLMHATKGPLASWYQHLLGHGWVDWLFMLGLLGIGLSLLLGVAMRLGAVAGSVLLLMMWAAILWPVNNPLIDEHIIYIFVLAALLVFDKYQIWGLGGWWKAQSWVQKMAWLK